MNAVRRLATPAVAGRVVAPRRTIFAGQDHWRRHPMLSEYHRHHHHRGRPAAPTGLQERTAASSSASRGCRRTRRRGASWSPRASGWRAFDALDYEGGCPGLLRPTDLLVDGGPRPQPCLTLAMLRPAMPNPSPATPNRARTQPYIPVRPTGLTPPPRSHHACSRVLEGAAPGPRVGVGHLRHLPCWGVCLQHGIRCVRRQTAGRGLGFSTQNGWPSIAWRTVHALHHLPSPTCHSPPPPPPLASTLPLSTSAASAEGAPLREGRAGRAGDCWWRRPLVHLGR